MILKRFKIGVLRIVRSHLLGDVLIALLTRFLRLLLWCLRCSGSFFFCGVLFIVFKSSQQINEIINESEVLSICSHLN